MTHWEGVSGGGFCDQQLFRSPLFLPYCCPLPPQFWSPFSAQRHHLSPSNPSSLPSMEWPDRGVGWWAVGTQGPLAELWPSLSLGDPGL